VFIVVPVVPFVEPVMPAVAVPVVLAVLGPPPCSPATPTSAPEVLDIGRVEISPVSLSPREFWLLLFGLLAPPWPPAVFDVALPRPLAVVPPPLPVQPKTTTPPTNTITGKYRKSLIQTSCAGCLTKPRPEWTT